MISGPSSVASAQPSVWVPIIRSWALTRGYALHPGTSCVASFTGSSRCWHGLRCAAGARRTSSTNTEEPPDQPRQGVGHPHHRGVWVPIIRSWALTRGFALHPGTRNRYEIRYTRTQQRPPSRQVNDHGRVSGTHKAVAEPGEFAMDAAISPSRILSCEAQCELAKLRRGRRPARRSMWLGPVPDDAAPMPTQQRVGGDQPPDSARSL